MSAIDHIETLHNELPHLFQDITLDPDWDEDYLIIPIDNPTYFPNPESSDAQLNHLVDSRGIDENEVDLSNEIEGDFIEAGLPINDTKILNTLGGSHAGAPLLVPAGYKIPPTDSLAFYLPYHYFHPIWWGIYIRVEGLAFISRWIKDRHPLVTSRQANSAARIFLFYHEAFHHKTECFATRLEVTHRKPLFRYGFEKYYQDTLFTSDCLEESLANALALDEVQRRIKDPKVCKPIMESLVDFVRNSPPGFSEGIDYRGSAFTSCRWKFSEEAQRYSLTGIPSQSAEIWATANHMFDPIANVNSRVNYILPESSRLAKRIRMGRTLMKPIQVIKKINKMVGIKRLKNRKGNHHIYETNNGKRFPIPSHPGDLRPATLQQIIKQAGINMTIREFQNA